MTPDPLAVKIRRERSRTVWLTVVLAIMCSGSPVSAQTRSGGFADTTLRRQVESQGARFVEGVRSHDPELRKRLASELWAPARFTEMGEERAAGAFARIADRFGKLEFHHAEAFASGSAAAPRVVLHVYARSPADGRWHDLQFLLDPEPPHRLSQLLFIADVAEPIYLPNGSIEDPSTIAWLAGYVDQLIEKDDLAGGLLVAKGDRVLFERTFGFADSARRRLMSPATRFNMASGSKMFTALVIAQLAAEGRVAWDAPLARYRPELARYPGLAPVTIAQLLSHTSGIGEYWTDAYEKARSGIRTLEDYVPFIVSAGNPDPPGQKYVYCNSNFILAGLVIEAVTRRPYEQVVRERILEPLAMTHTSFGPFKAADTSLAEPLSREGQGWRIAGRGGRGSSAGGAASTMGDLFAFGRALVGGRIVPDSTLARMTTAQTPAGGDGAYGFGFILEGRMPEARSFGHGGITRGVNFEYRYFPESDITLIAFSNQDNGAYDDLRRNTTRLVTGER